MSDLTEATNALYVHRVYNRTTDMPAPKEIRWNLRVAQSTDDLVRAAAVARGQSLTEFVSGAAADTADRELADRTRFVLTEQQWSEFESMLDRPPQVKPELLRLFSAANVFE